jgi:hypothetical protein
VFSGHHGGAGRVTSRGRAVVFRKGDPLRSEAIKVWGLGLRMTAQRLDPVVEVIDRDEKDVWFLLGYHREGRNAERGDWRPEKESAFLHLRGLEMNGAEKTKFYSPRCGVSFRLIHPFLKRTCGIRSSSGGEARE